MTLGLLSSAAPAAAAQRHPRQAVRLRQARVPVTVPALLARARPAREAQVVAPAIEMEHLTSHARLLLRPDVRGGGFSQKQMRALMDFLRCHHTQKRKPIDQRLVSLLYATARHYKNAKLYVVAGYRAPSVALAKGNPKSPHKRGVACDFRLEGVSIEALRDYLRRSYNNVGVGYYPNSGFVHLDVGRKLSAYWIDYSSPGQKARYAPGEQEEQEGVAQKSAPPREPTAPTPGPSLPRVHQLDQDAEAGVASPHDS